MSCKIDPSYYLSIKDKDGNYVYFKVEYEVYTYVKQLEACINNPKESGLTRLYPERFKRNELQTG